MTTQEIIGFIIAEGFMVIGAVGSMLPAIPSTPVVFLAALGHKIYFGDNSISYLILAILGAITLFSLVMDYIASLVGARKLGATWRGVAGALIGGILGLFLGPWGILIGPFIGALTFEMMGGRQFEEASKAGFGALLGIVAGTLGKFICAIAMASLFAANIIWRAF
ncbi:MAG: DUF456 domain-containing protein [Limisphaerales bacterium]|jgi:uncharacterized protein YqgC (DUF456 family)|nr:hypothetical protein [Pedosphaera sp.]MBL6843426.1 DUF456 domain-containing protein [Verrucomicrobiae bacterium]HAQ99735.1 DUF456 domain-containing protein [Verrucomicrobiales bacterium]HAW01935.1 DUF456 domain-containing protein [Verrucomicrobiales bacterium]HBP57010.1 DUF456 domain-containing protein [Verrucomicrobiales bacterium]|tara:strand:- start:821 stop:1318 length:498 start_codon:yes stop_codon:yes gene_type:complete